MDRVLEVPFEGEWYSFQTRIEPGYDSRVTDKIIVREIFVENVYDVCEGDLDDTGVVIDIGGNVGAFSIFCAALGARAVYAFEPDSMNWDRLTANIADNGLDGIIHPVKVGVSDTSKERELVSGQATSYIVGTKELHDEDVFLWSGDAPREQVRLISLESVFADNSISSCDVLKMDCEGSEYDVVAGAGPEILAKARYITMEFHRADEVTFGKMISRLTLTHNVHIIGKHNAGGQIYARRY